MVQKITTETPFIPQLPCFKKDDIRYDYELTEDAFHIWFRSQSDCDRFRQSPNIRKLAQDVAALGRKHKRSLKYITFYANEERQVRRTLHSIFADRWG